MIDRSAMPAADAEVARLMRETRDLRVPRREQTRRLDRKVKAVVRRLHRVVRAQVPAMIAARRLVTAWVPETVVVRRLHHVVLGQVPVMIAGHRLRRPAPVWAAATVIRERVRPIGTRIGLRDNRAIRATTSQSGMLAGIGPGARPDSWPATGGTAACGCPPVAVPTNPALRCESIQVIMEPRSVHMWL